MMTIWRDDLLDITSKSVKWVEANFSNFFNNEKSAVEYYQMRLFDNRNNFLSDLKELRKIYNPLDEEKSEKIYFRQIEHLALESLSGKNNTVVINELFEQGFFYRLVDRKIPFDILSNRDYLYIITHDIFYTSIFGKDTAVIESIYRNKETLLTVFENALLISLKHHDVDVLMELLCCIYILNVTKNIPEYILNMIVKFIKQHQLPDGSIPFDISISNPTFDDVYHTCLVASILYYCMARN